MTLKTTLAVSVNALQTNPATLGTPYSPLEKTWSVRLTNGALAGQADELYYATRTLAASATEDLDFAGALEDALGTSFVLARVKGLIVAAASANTNNVVVGAAAGSPWSTLLGTTGTITVRPGAVMAAFAGQADATGYAVTATTADLLKVANSGAGSSVTYDVVIVGCAS